MKTIQKSLSLVAFLALMIFVTSCGEQDDIVPEPDLDLVYDDLAVNQAFEDLDNITLEVLEENGLGARLSESPICSEAIIQVNESSKKITVDFGQGCTKNGITRKGKIEISYSGNVLFPGATIVTNFEGYEVNDLKIEGTRTIKNSKIDILNSTVTLAVEVRNGNVTWPDGTFVTIRSDQVREIALAQEGYQASITGTASGKSREGFDYTSSTTSPLIVTQTCVESGILTPGQGVLEFVYRGINVSVDYGFGTCDKVVTLTFPGGAREITLD
ncbi:hypothetical protein [Algoriphagus namhaensis]